MIVRKEYVITFDNGRVEHRIDVWCCFILIYRYKKIVKEANKEE